MDLLDLIKHENESTYLDYKKSQYTKNNYVDFLKDIMSMANADFDGEKYIVTGIKIKTDRSKDIIGIKKDDFIDAATYQQIIIENIDSDLHIEYYPINYENKLLGIFKINRSDDKPYMMKKDFYTLRKGDSFIRKGEHQCRLLRGDIDKIIRDKINKNSFSGEIEICFSNNGKKEIELPVLDNNIIFPSKEMALSLRNTIKFKIESESYPEKGVDLSELLNDDINYFEVKKIIKENLKSRRIKLSEHPEIENLLESLKEVKKNYSEEDNYILFEEYSNKININILNKGSNYIKDATLELSFNKKNLAVSIYEIEKPAGLYPLGVKDTLIYPALQKYPEIDCDDKYIKIFHAFGDLRNNIIRKNIFDVPIRIAFLRNLLNKSIKIHCRISGENIKKPFEEYLKIKVV